MQKKVEIYAQYAAFLIFVYIRSAYICIYMCLPIYTHVFQVCVRVYAYATTRLRRVFSHPGQQPKLILGFIDCLVSVSFSDPGTCGTFSFTYELDNTTLKVRRFRPRDTRKSVLFIKQLKDHSAKIEVLHFPSQDFI